MLANVRDYLKVIAEEKERLSDVLIPFDEVQGEQEGSSSKGFAMVKGSEMMDLYDIMKNNPDTHFKFCGSDYIKMSTPEEFQRMFFSGIIRKSRSDTKFATSELIGSRVAEIFGVDAPYVTPLGNTHTIVASMDFLKFSEEMETFADYTGALLPRQANATSWLRFLNRRLDKEQKTNPVDNETRNHLIKELIRHYLVRKLILRDNDFNCGNLAVVTGPNKTPNLVSFDFEFSLNNWVVFDLSGGYGSDFDEYVIRGLVEEYPQELREVLSEIQMTPERTKQIRSVLNKFLENEDMAHYWTESMSRTIYLLNYYQEKHTLEQSM